MLFVADHAAALCDALGAGAHRGALRRERLRTTASEGPLYPLESFGVVSDQIGKNPY
jgi:hypothetical protein